MLCFSLVSKLAIFQNHISPPIRAEAGREFRQRVSYRLPASAFKPKNWATAAVGDCNVVAVHG